VRLSVCDSEVPRRDTGSDKLPRMGKRRCALGLVLGWLLLAGCSGRTTSAPSSGGGGGSSGEGGGTASGGFAAAGGGGASSGGAAGTLGSGGAVGGSAAAGSGAVGGSATGGTGGAHQGLRDYLGDPAFPDDYWQWALPEESGIDAGKIDAAVGAIESDGLEVHAFLVAHRGKLVVERYGWDTGTNPAVPSEPHQVVPSERRPLYSATKSFLSALIGIAREEGALPDLEATAASFFPDYELLSPSPEKSSITLVDLLTMRSGLEWTEGEQSTFEAPDPARAMFSRPVVATVGETWNYSSGVSDILAEILRVATGATPLEYAEERLFGPMGIESPPWVAAANGTEYGGWGLSLTARELLRFGELYRNRGDWLGKSVVPAEWTDESTTPRCDTPWGGKYAYHFWVPDLPGFFNALGAFGQLMYVSRERELVVVFTANIPSDVADSSLRNIIASYVLPALPG
jgi:CubicO group peptidase (beta-lactamase class C family)